jgi:hypothetical protein
MAALLACTLMAGCSIPPDEAAVAKPFDVQELAQGASGAGCWYTRSTDSMPIMAVDHGSHDRNPPATARLRIDGFDHVLEKLGSAAGEPFRYGNEAVVAEAFDFRDIGTECSGECEGSFYEARLRIDYDGQSRLLDVFAHCGA